MTGQAYSAPSVRQLAAVVDRLAPRDPARWDAREPAPGAGGVRVQVSAARGRQLWMLVGMFDRAIGREGMPDRAGRRVEQLFTWAALKGFWQLVEAGELRRWEKDVGKPPPVASLRIARDCLSILARVVVPDRVVRLPVVEPAELKATVDEGSRAALFRGLVDMAGEGPLEREGLALSAQDRSRLLAMVAIVLDTGTRSGELAGLRLDDVADGLDAVRVRRRQQRAGPPRLEEVAQVVGVHPRTVQAVLHGEWERASEAVRERVLAAAAELEPVPEVEWYGLREGTQVALGRWLDVRDGVVGALPIEGGRTGLWVTLQPSKAGPAGITIRAQGLRQAYARGITALNFVMAGQYGWEPLPTTMEQLRRAVDVVPLDEVPEA